MTTLETAIELNEEDLAPKSEIASIYQYHVEDIKDEIKRLHEYHPQAYFFTMSSATGLGNIFKEAYKIAWPNEPAPKMLVIDPHKIGGCNYSNVESEEWKNPETVAHMEQLKQKLRNHKITDTISVVDECYEGKAAKYSLDDRDMSGRQWKRAKQALQKATMELGLDIRIVPGGIGTDAKPFKSYWQKSFTDPVKSRERNKKENDEYWEIFQKDPEKAGEITKTGGPYRESEKYRVARKNVIYDYKLNSYCGLRDIKKDEAGIITEREVARRKVDLLNKIGRHIGKQIVQEIAEERRQREERRQKSIIRRFGKQIAGALKWMQN